MNDKYLITVVTVCYNSEKTIRDTFESLLNQTNKNFDYIVVDGKSTDNTLNIIKEYLPKFDGRMRYISEKDNGIYDAMNKGISLCSGDYIGIINSDDWYETDAIENIINSINDNPEVDLFYGLIRLIKDGKEYMIRRNNYDFINEMNGLIQHPTCFVKRKVYDKYGVFNTKYKISADLDLMLRLVNNGVKYKPIDKVITNFRIGGASYQNDNYTELIDIMYRNGFISRKCMMKKLAFNKIKNIIGFWRNNESY
ncbi:glycosyltransferase family 2 protein [Clostridium thermarum]|uniref:glycosyltransferase family 2 protein n=1 Tax=Clostridium thermarum TaxID=1716543 RepID=UPI001121A4EA|nr:glycosyltransferase family 2 protein [Clostridium thermarum]